MLLASRCPIALRRSFTPDSSLILVLSLMLNCRKQVLSCSSADALKSLAKRKLETAKTEGLLLEGVCARAA